MTIHFKLNGQLYNNPDNDQHKQIQNKIRTKIESAIEQHKNNIKIENTANLEVNYNEATADNPTISLNGFGPDSHPKMLIILQEIFNKA